MDNASRKQLSAEPIKISLEETGIPDDAYEVVVYTFVGTGYLSRSSVYTSHILVNLLDANNDVTDTRQLFFKTYDQAAVSYNSENMVLAIEPGASCSVQAQVVDQSASKVAAYIQITGYYTLQCHPKS